MLGTATRQVRDTVRYLSDHEEVQIENQRGHVFKLKGRALNQVIKLIVYIPGDNLPESCRRIKHYVSTSSAAGIIHILPIQDYLEICRTLFTPAEITEYFGFRERTITRWPEAITQVSEQALMVQFLYGDEEGNPDERYVEYLMSASRLVFVLKDSFLQIAAILR